MIDVEKLDSYNKLLEEKCSNETHANEIYTLYTCIKIKYVHVFRGRFLTSHIGP